MSMKWMYLIYMHTNRLNGKPYIGWTKRVGVMNPQQAMMRRWRGHLKYAKSGSPCLFHRAIRKHGSGDNVWNHEVIDVLMTKEGAKHVEALWIKQRRTYVYAQDGHGYNATRGGDGHVRSRQEAYDRYWTPERRAECSAQMRANNPMKRPDVVARQRVTLSASTIGVAKSRQHCENIRLSKLGDKNPMSSVHRSVRKSKKADEE